MFALLAQVPNDPQRLWSWTFGGFTVLQLIGLAVLAVIVIFNSPQIAAWAVTRGIPLLFTLITKGIAAFKQAFKNASSPDMVPSSSELAPTSSVNATNTSLAHLQSIVSAAVIEGDAELLEKATSIFPLLQKKIKDSSVKVASVVLIAFTLVAHGCSSAPEPEPEPIGNPALNNYNGGVVPADPEEIQYLGNEETFREQASWGFDDQ